MSDRVASHWRTRFSLNRVGPLTTTGRKRYISTSSSLGEMSRLTDYDYTFDGGRDRDPGIDLSTSSSTSSGALISSVRRERLAREAQRRNDAAARKIQAFYRGCRLGREARDELWTEVEKEEGAMGSWSTRGRALALLLRDRWCAADKEVVERKTSLLVRWCAQGVAKEEGGEYTALLGTVVDETVLTLATTGFVAPVDTIEGWMTVLSLLSVRILEAIEVQPTCVVPGS